MQAATGWRDASRLLQERLLGGRGGAVHTPQRQRVQGAGWHQQVGGNMDAAATRCHSRSLNIGQQSLTDIRPRRPRGGMTLPSSPSQKNHPRQKTPKQRAQQTHICWLQQSDLAPRTPPGPAPPKTHHTPVMPAAWLPSTSRMARLRAEAGGG